MSEEKLKLPQKLFAALERLIRDTRVKDLDLEWKVNTKPLYFSMDTGINSLDFSIPARVAEQPVTIETDTVEIVYQLAHPSVNDASLEALTTEITDENVELINTAVVVEEPLQLTTTTPVVDFFQQFAIDPGRLTASFLTGSSSPGSVLVRSIEPCHLKSAIHRLPESKLKIPAVVKDNLFFFRRLTVQRKPVVLSFLSEKEQLVYWKRAVTQTGKEARNLQILGVYTGVPYECVENIKMNYNQMSLTYHFRARAHNIRGEMRDIALFNDKTVNKILMVVK